MLGPCDDSPGEVGDGNLFVNAALQGTLMEKTAFSDKSWELSSELQLANAVGEVLGRTS